MTTLWLDTETFSEADLKKVGVYVYAGHPSTEVTLFSYALDDQAPRCWDVTTGAPMPAKLAAAIADDSVVVIARNAGFDRIVLRDVMGIDIPIKRWRCAMVKALCHALPGAMADSNAALGMSVDYSKLGDGIKLVHKFCKPAPKNHKVRRYTRDTSPAEWARFIEYCDQDVAAMRHEWHLTPNLNYTADEIALWHLDQQVNDRGFQADVELAHAGASAADVEKALLAERLRFLTHEIVDGPTKREQLLAYLNAVYKLNLPDLTKDTLEQRLKGNDLDPVCRELMAIRLAANKTSTAKYAALVQALGADGRFRGGLQFAGAARTRRFAGRIFQPQNLPSRSLPKADKIEGYIAALKRGTHDLIYDDLMLLGAASLRGLVVAPKGKKLVVADLSNIEGRILAWVSGEGWKLKAFREYDAGTGPDLYNVTAVSIIGGDPWRVETADRNVFGKVPDLASGYRGGVPGFQTFARAYGVRMADYWQTIQANIAEAHILRAQESVSQGWAIAQINELGISEAEWVACETVKLAWRARHPATVQFWKAIQEAAIAATRNPETLYSCGRLQVMARKSKAGHLWLYIKLPSGKFLTYFEPRVTPGDYGDSLTYMSLASEDGKTGSRAWVRTYTHGGKLTGNTCVGPHTQVLTARGLVPIVEVTVRDQVWDGVEWVSTDGLIDRGMQETGTWKGIHITQDHLIHDGTSWKPVMALGDSGSDAALAWAHASVPSWWSTPASVTAALRLAAAIVRGKWRFLRAHFFAGKRSVAGRAGGRLPERNAGRCSASQAPSYVTHGRTATPRWCRAAQTPNTQPSTTMAGGGSPCVQSGSPTATPSSATSVGSTGTTPQDSILTGGTTNSDTNPATSGSSHEKRATATNETTDTSCSAESASHAPSLWSGISRIGRALKPRTTTSVGGETPSGSWRSTTKVENVFDLLNCGPRNSFTVLTDAGFAMVHNCQTLAGDLLKERMPAVEAAGYQIVLSVHDEIIAEAPDSSEYSAEHLASLLATNPAWAEGLPLAAAGFECTRYRKD